MKEVELHNQEEFERVKKALTWTVTGETGLSSVAIVRTHFGLPPGPHGDTCNHPHDPADLRRCVQLLEECPFIDIKCMRGTSIYWDALIGNWKMLMEIFEIEKKDSDNSSLTYNLMRMIFLIVEDRD